MTTPPARVAVIGAGATPLVGELAAEGYEVIAIDISTAAISALGAQLIGRTGIEYLVTDVRTLRLGEVVVAWHDRAVFHFLVHPIDRAAYVASARASVRVGGHVVMATFAPDGPTQCSGLPVERHDATTLSAAFDDGFELVQSFEADHETPWGTMQRFTHAVLRRVGT